MVVLWVKMRVKGTHTETTFHGEYPKGKILEKNANSYTVTPNIFRSSCHFFFQKYRSSIKKFSSKVVLLVYSN